MIARRFDSLRLPLSHYPKEDIQRVEIRLVGRSSNLSPAAKCSTPQFFFKETLLPLLCSAHEVQIELETTLKMPIETLIKLNNFLRGSFHFGRQKLKLFQSFPLEVRNQLILSETTVFCSKLNLTVENNHGGNLIAAWSIILKKIERNLSSLLQAYWSSFFFSERFYF